MVTRLGALLKLVPRDPRAALPSPVVACSVCGQGHDPRYGYCGHCARRKRALATAPERAAAMLASLPAGWAWARTSNREWRARCDARVLPALAAWDGTTSLMICGPARSGKSSGVMARIVSLIEAHVSAAERGELAPLPDVVWLSEAELAVPSGVKPWEHMATPRAIAAGLLVLDEVGIMAPRPDLVGIIADARYSAGKPTVTTSGRTPHDLAGQYGDAVYRRLACWGTREVVVDLHGGGRP